ncbi:alpha/beta fold hydrolase [Brevibacterium yomogidense]|uniref:alpha/beta fold hydrolase n=1 Tax=Brevibacterium yomogidense TaxID=946573 RepID=UPI002FCD1894
MNPRLPGLPNPRPFPSAVVSDARAGIPAAPAQLPHEAVGATLDGFDPAWSRLVTVDTLDGPRTFHVLDTGPVMAAAGTAPVGTIVAAHGNPTWSYMWRHLAAEGLTRGWRVIAVDHLDMGFSERLPHARAPRPSDPGIRRIADRVADFDAVVTTLLAEGPTAEAAPATQPTGTPDAVGASATAGAPAHPVVTIGHDWGGVISLTWASRNQDRVAAAVTLNTAVHVAEGDSLPASLQTALAGPMLPMSTVHTDLFLRVTLSLAKDKLTPAAEAGYRAPYRSASRRGGIGGFVADIPFPDTHPSYSELQQLGEDIAGFEKPALIVWGPKDPVFLERFLRDLRQRLPQADVHRFEKSGHMLSEQEDMHGTVLDWLDQKFPGGTIPTNDPATTDGTAPAATGGEPTAGAAAPADPTTSSAAVPAGPATASATGSPRYMFTALEENATSGALASVDMSQDPVAKLTWREVNDRVRAIAEGLHDLGLKQGDRVSMLVPPGNDLTTVLYAVLRAGGIAVVADAGLGPQGMTRAVKSADPQWIIGAVPGLTLSRLAGWPGRRISVDALGGAQKRLLNVETSIADLVADGTPAAASGTVVSPDRVPLPDPDADAAILFTSGSTGPAKGVRYTHARLAALMGVLRDFFQVRPGTSLVAGFAPFALLGPGISTVSITPDMEVTKPRTLTATALAESVVDGEATMIFASPAAYHNVVATSGDLTAAQRDAFTRITLVLSAGAPVPLALMDDLAGLFPNAAIRSPYGMTEGLLLTDIERVEVADALANSDGDLGVCVGRPVDGVRVALAPIGDHGEPSDTLLEGEAARGILGEFVVHAAHSKAGYDRLWKTDREAARDTVDGLLWHRTNDIGHIDREGRVWLEGRVQHLITPPTGPLGPGGPEAVVDTLPHVYRSAAVGVGPAGTQALVIVVEPTADVAAKVANGPAPLSLSSMVREIVAERTGEDVAAVLVSTTFPTDIRHNSKIDRPRLARWAERVLAGGKVGTP